MDRSRMLVLGCLLLAACGDGSMRLDGVIGQEVFVLSDGLILVTRTAIQSYDRDGALRASRDATLADPDARPVVDYDRGVLLETTTSEILSLDPSTLAVIARIPRPTDCAATFAAGRHALCRVGFDVLLFDPSTGEPRGTIEGAGDFFRVAPLPDGRVLLDDGIRSVLIDPTASPPSVVAEGPIAHAEALLGSPVTHAVSVPLVGAFEDETCRLHRLDACPGPTCLAEDGVLPCLPVDRALGAVPEDQRWTSGPDGSVFRMQPASCGGEWCYRVYRFGPIDRAPRLVAELTEPLGRLIGFAHDPVSSELVIADRIGCSYDATDTYYCLATVVRRVAIE